MARTGVLAVASFYRALIVAAAVAEALSGASATLSDCFAPCRCTPMSSEKASQNWIIALSAHRQQRLLVGPGRNYHRADAGEAGFRQMTCVGLLDMPNAIPSDVRKLMVYGDRFALPRRLHHEQQQQQQQQQQDHVRAGPVDWDKAFTVEENPAGELYQIRNLSARTFSGGQGLQELFIEGNDIQTLEPEAFSAVPDLKMLSFRKNHLKELGADSLKGLRSLKNADFSHNEIRALNAETFHHSSGLLSLSLSSNSLEHIGSNHLNSLPQLTELDLSANRLHDLDSHTFAAQVNLTVLNLSRNRIVSLDAGCFSGLTNLQNLNVANNGIADIVDGTFAELRSLRMLDLSGNGIERLTSQMLAGMSQLEELNLERNQIISVAPLSFSELQQLRVLRLGYNSLSRIDALTLSGLQSLHVLRLESNAIEKLDSAALRPVPELRELSVASNRLAAVSKGTFRGLTELRELHMERNQIKHIDDEAFAAGSMGQLSKLGWLFLDGNQLPSIQSRSFAGIPYLRHLSISASGLKSVDERAFAYVRNLVTLVLADNQLAELRPQTFARQRTLRVLNLAGNALPAICTGCLAGLSSLEHLFAARNRIGSIGADAFADLTALSRVDLSRNNLAWFDLGSVLNGTRLQHLDLSKNRLRTVAIRNVTASGSNTGELTLLKSLNLADNALETMAGSIVSVLAKGSEVHLSGNPWRCDCNLRWLPKLSKSNGVAIAQVDKLVCKSPGVLSGREVNLLELEDMVCSGDTVLSKSNSAHTLRCVESPEQIAKMIVTQKRSRKHIQSTAATVIRQSRDAGDAVDVLCHGFVLSEGWIVTKASCWTSGDYSGLDEHLHLRRGSGAPAEVVIGSGDLRRVRRAAVKSLIVHPDYSAESSEHDLAVVGFEVRPEARDPPEIGVGGAPELAAPPRTCVPDAAQLLELVRRGSAAWTAVTSFGGRRQDVEPIPLRTTLGGACWDLVAAGSVERRQQACRNASAASLLLLGRSLLVRRTGLQTDGSSLRFSLESHWAVGGFHVAPPPSLPLRDWLRSSGSDASTAGSVSETDAAPLLHFTPLFPYIEWLEETIRDGEGWTEHY